MADSMESNFVSMKQAVEFLDVLDQYSYNEDLHCNFKCNDYTPQEGDRIAIFKLGWNLVKDYVVFEWAPVGNRERKQSVVFNKHILPKNNTEIYQICYVSGENVLHGASSSFQFCAEVPAALMMQSTMPINLETVPNLTQTGPDADEELKKLREENALLRQSLKALLGVESTANCRNYDEDISQLRNVTECLRTSVNNQQMELNMLKTKIAEGGEEYKKLYLEKVKVERKYEKLKNKVEGDVKPVAEIVNFDIGDLKSIPPFPFKN